MLLPHFIPSLEFFNINEPSNTKHKTLDVYLINLSFRIFEALCKLIIKLR